MPSDWIAWVIVLPFVAALATLFAGSGRVASIVLPFLALQAFTVSGLARQVVNHGAFRYPLGGWEAPLGIELYVDGLSSLMLLTTFAVGLAVSLYALSYFRGHGAQASAFWPLWLFLWGGLNALFLSADLFNLYVTLELVTLAAVSLIALSAGPALTAALRYLVYAVLASLCYLLGVSLLYGAYSTLDLAQLSQVVAPGLGSGLALSLLTLALLLKSALFPLHFWLPEAHAAAPAPVSALLSGLVVKAPLYLLLRLGLDVFPDLRTPALEVLIAGLAVGAIVWGSWQALIAKRLKLLVAWSTVAQLGLLFLVFPIISGGQVADATVAGYLLIAAHALAKAAFFLATGSVLHAFGHDRMDGLAGMARHLPITVSSIALASMSLAGLPPSGGFVGKWLLLGAAWGNGQWAWALLIVVGGLATVGYLFRILSAAFTPPIKRQPRQPVPLALELTTFTLALAAVLLGFAATPLARLLSPLPA